MAPSCAVLAGKVVAITGVSSGIGRAAARQFAAQGAKVVGIGRLDALTNNVGGM
ncbi:MAG: SDR family NAD(P)-dependent oxidoreductase [Gammaproteobacteria bacterium]|nr:SDR family NAD(P)-dependent oxidoreductase [Gammaproteobacteria bacterium]